MAPIRKHFRAQKNRVQNLSGPNLFFFRKYSWSLKTNFNAKMSEIRQKQGFSIFILVRPQPYLDPKMEHFERIYGHTTTVILS